MYKSTHLADATDTQPIHVYASFDATQSAQFMRISYQTHLCMALNIFLLLLLIVYVHR